MIPLNRNDSPVRTSLDNVQVAYHPKDGRIVLEISDPGLSLSGKATVEVRHGSSAYHRLRSMMESDGTIQVPEIVAQIRNLKSVQEIDIYEIESRNDALPLGTGSDGKTVWWDMAENPNLLITGSVCMGALSAMLEYSYAAQQNVSRLGFSPSANFNDILKRNKANINFLSDEIDCRLSAETAEETDITILFLDYIDSTFAKHPELAPKLRKIMEQGHAFGIYVAAQRNTLGLYRENQACQEVMSLFDARLIGVCTPEGLDEINVPYWVKERNTVIKILPDLFVGDALFTTKQGTLTTLRAIQPTN